MSQSWKNRKKKYAQRTDCSNWVVHWTLWSQLYLDEMNKECWGWNTACKQEWNLFLLERMFHNTATMWHKELQRWPCQIPLALEPSETAVENPSMWTLVGSRDAELLLVAEWIYKGKYIVVPSVFTHVQWEDLMKELQRTSLATWPGLPYKAKGGQPNCLLVARGSPRVWKRKIKTLRQNSRTDGPSWVREEPILGEGVGQGGSKPLAFPFPSLCQSPSSSPLQPHPDEQLHHPLESLKLHHKSRDSKDRAWWWDASL